MEKESTRVEASSDGVFAIAASAFNAMLGLVLVLAITALFVANAARRHRLAEAA